MISSYYDISRNEFDKIKKQVEQVEIEMEQEETNHRIALNAFTNKFKHLEYDHEIFITKTLIDNSEKAVKEEDEKRHQRENIYMDKKANLKQTIKENADLNRDNIEKKKLMLEDKINKKKANLEDRMQKINDK
jgi:hypothetical protein